MMTKAQVIAEAEAISREDFVDLDRSVMVVQALVALGVVYDDGRNFHPLPLLDEYPATIHEIVAGMCSCNTGETKQ